MTLLEHIEALKSALTVDQLAGLLGVSKKTVYKAIKTNSLPAIKVGSSIRLDPEATAKWLRDQAMVKSSRT
jgi:excisionase family DNA binding protein